eukprot:PITA_27005
MELGELENPESDGYESQKSKDRILLLEKYRSQILLAREEEWRLKSRVIWLKAGDENTKFFHNYAKGRKIMNTMWKLKNEEGREANTFESLSCMGRSHFQNLFTNQGEKTLAEVIKTAQCFPGYVEEEEAESLMGKVTKEEVESIIKYMAKDKSPDGRQIHEAIGVAQETIHSIKQMKRKGAVVKIDLSKAYDKINWTYLRMLLTHLGFKVDFINWIMGCITSVSFVVLINGASSTFFKGQRGLRQGCPLSLFFFLLVEKGLSQLILKAKREGTMKGLEVAVNLFISHLLFGDDILLFSNGNMSEIKELKRILELFMKAIGMQVNYRKSQLILEGFNR